jgi:hypothetical protein
MLPAFRLAAPTSSARAVSDEFGQYLALREPHFLLDAPARHLHCLGGVAPRHAIPRGHEVCRGG